MWRVLQRPAIDSGRERTACLMRSVGLSGKHKGGAPLTTRKPKGPDLRPDLVHREFKGSLALIGCGWWTLLMCTPGKGSCRQPLSLMCIPEDCRVGDVGLDAHRSLAAAGARPGYRVR